MTVSNSWRMTGGIAVLAAAILLLAPCGHAAEPRDHVLRFAATDVPAALGKPYKSIGGTPGSVWDVLFDCLTTFDDSGAVPPALAARWENVAPTTWRFHLRQDAKFSNGNCDMRAERVSTGEGLRMITFSKHALVASVSVYGLSDETIIERCYRDVRPMRIYEGTSEAMRSGIARNVLKAGAA